MDSPQYFSHSLPIKMEVSLQKLLMLAIFWLFCFHTYVGSVRSQCLRDQQSLLLQLKQNLTFDSTLSFKLVSWNSSTDCCSWSGVKCGGGGYVIGLDLSGEAISDGINSSSSLFDLHHLQSLDLSSNSFYGAVIPSGFEKLANLQYLNLSDSYFTGRILAEISGLTRLTELDLSGIDLWVEGYGWSSVLSSLTSLRVMNLARCNLSGPIDSSLAKLRSLSVITLSENNISSPVPEFLGNFSNLTSLNLYSCGLDGTFPEKIFQLPRLQSLDISFNYELQGSIPEFSENESLQTLLLSRTSFGGNVPESIGNLKRLSILDLGYCNFSGSIPDSTGKLTELVFLDFRHNNFSGLIPSFSSAKNLSVLYLSENFFSGSVNSTNWTGLTKLESIDLGYNSLSGHIPASLIGIPSLLSIYLNENQFTGKLEGFSGLTSSALNTLDLSNNKLEGPFPEFVFRLQSLMTLRLSSNNFNGAVKLSSFQQLKNLSALDLSYNGLWIDQTGIDYASFPNISTIYLASCNLTRFPEFLKRRSDSSSLDLRFQNNKISGEIPDWIWRFEYLRYLNLSYNDLVNFQPPLVYHTLIDALDLSHNNLQGELPKPPPSVIYLDYSSNNYSSVIPADFGISLKQARFVSLANNNLRGSIPQSICNATNLVVLNLANNSLNGAIPPCLFGIESLKVLNLRGNSLSGNIPDTFPSKCDYLQTLDLNGNRFEGKIPRSLANCTLLEVLDLGNNHINDVFPSHLKNVSSLRVLVLRSNHLHGPIHCSNGNFSWQMLQIIDLAFNNFSGDLPTQCLRTWKAMMYRDDEVGYIEFVALGSFYYQVSVTVTAKNLVMPLVKVLNVFTSIDVSYNKFGGMIPEVIGEFKALYGLNLSHNALTGPIPSSVGNLNRLESMDLSTNSLTGEIPQGLGQLNFLSVLNLSNNHLVGRIPVSTQIQSFPASSFQGNDGLCGPPLKESCIVSVQPEDENPDDETQIYWNPLSVLLGFAFGLGMSFLPLLWGRWRTWYNRHVDILISKLFPQLNPRSRNYRSRNLRTNRTTGPRVTVKKHIAGDETIQSQFYKRRTDE